ncbi:hypothetical protein SAMN05192561_103208 [Halopenitus malekzadehii]|uniref:Uncharacterized protein n=1 Tax=Halopenitus malekzadehii TaxID=1267564 RepID=A0A1H6ITB2_9EURY|nr:hypothetical protein SAMN05192561_103208 [Halopenitus malekzadehii]
MDAKSAVLGVAVRLPRFADCFNRNVPENRGLEILHRPEDVVVRPGDDRGQRLPPVGVQQRHVGQFLARVGPFDRVLERVDDGSEPVQPYSVLIPSIWAWDVLTVRACVRAGSVFAM